MFVIFLHLGMLLARHDTVKCPICSKSELLEANGTEKIGKRLIVCLNDHYIHWRLGGQHFLTRTELNKMQEGDPILERKFGELVLN
jgi:hypothetical protein